MVQLNQTLESRLELLKAGGYLVNSGKFWGLTTDSDGMKEWNMGPQAAAELIKAAGGEDAFSKKTALSSTVYRLIKVG